MIDEIPVTVTVLRPEGRHAVMPVCDILFRNGGDDLKQNVENNYEFGVYWKDRAMVDTDGTYHTSEDPPLDPVLEIKMRGRVHAYFYPYDLLAVREPNGGWAVCRID